MRHGSDCRKMLMFCVDGHAGVVFMIVLVFGHLMAIAVIDFYVFCAQIDTRVNVCVPKFVVVFIVFSDSLGSFAPAVCTSITATTTNPSIY